MDTLVKYLESLTVTQGEGAGDSLNLLPWQRRFLKGAFRPTVKTGALSVARGNGKSTYLAGIACAALDGPIAVERGEVVIVASAFAQARIIFDHIVAFLQDKIAANPEDWSVQDSANVAKITYRPLGTKLLCKGSDPRRAHGLAPALVLADEPAQWVESTSARMLAALSTSLGKVPNSKMIALGTLPESDSGHWFEKWCLQGGCDYAQVHRADKDSPPFQRKTWTKANPSMAYMPELTAAIRADANRAKQDSQALQSFRALRLNAGVADVGQSIVLDAETWKGCETDWLPERVGAYVLGVDLGSSSAMSGAAAWWPSGRLEVCAYFPCEPDLARRGAKDGVGDLYQRMAARNELRQAGTRTVDVTELVQTAISDWGVPAVVVADRWRFSEIADALDESGNPHVPVTLRGMGFRDGASDLRAFRKAAIDGVIRTPESLLMRSAIAGARTVSDSAGNSKIAKAKESSERRDGHKDDALVAAVLAVAEGIRNPPAPPRKGRYLGQIG